MLFRSAGAGPPATVTLSKNAVCDADIVSSWGTPTRPTAPPGRAISIAVCIDWSSPTHSRTEWTPSPPVSSRTRSTASSPRSLTTFFDNVTIGGGPSPARAYIEELMPDVLEGRIEPGRVFDRVVRLHEVPDGYRAMNEREAIKVLIEF